MPTLFASQTSMSLLASLTPWVTSRAGVEELLSLWWVRLAIIMLVFMPLVSLSAMFCIWLERKVAGHMQSRIGPNRTGGPFGWAQSIADGLKLLLKEDLIPSVADGILFRFAPYLVFAPVFATLCVLPFGPNLVFESRLQVGVFYVLAMMGVEVMGVLLAGWASNNKWSIYGAMREACQMISYEIPLGLSIIVAVMTAGTLNMNELGARQGGGIHTWLVFHNPFVFLAFIVYFVASLASNKRAPFDLPESESELVAGYHTEYSGIRFSFFFMAEYVAMFVVGGIQAALFLGAWHDPFGILGWWYERSMARNDLVGIVLVNVIGSGIFVFKAYLIILAQMWVRWTLPRPRIDQVLYVCVKVLLPAGCVLLAGAAVWQTLVIETRDIPWRDYNPWLQYPGSKAALACQVVLSLAGVVGTGLAVVWMAMGFLARHQVKKRLFEVGHA